MRSASRQGKDLIVGVKDARTGAYSLCYDCPCCGWPNAIDVPNRKLHMLVVGYFHSSNTGSNNFEGHSTAKNLQQILSIFIKGSSKGKTVLAGQKVSSKGDKKPICVVERRKKTSVHLLPADSRGGRKAAASV